MKALPTASVKSNVAVTAVRSASCSRGWLRVLVQTIFGLITVSSFVMIFSTAVKSPAAPRDINLQISHCIEVKCSFYCSRVPFYEEYQNGFFDDTEVLQKCLSINLTLKNSYFINNILPPRWLAHFRTPVEKLSIQGGNLRFISRNAFRSEFAKRIKSISFETVQISRWTPNTLKGLDSLQELRVKNCKIGDLFDKALAPVNDTLRHVAINVGYSWYPGYFTGSVDLPRLTYIDFSYNRFGNIINNSSLTHIRWCKVLNLSHSQITSIEKGTFDNLPFIEEINLSNNLLVTFTFGLFQSLFTATIRPKLLLHLNLWYCDCHQSEIIRLVANGYLFENTICHYPDCVKGMSFPDFSTYCSTEKLTAKIAAEDDQYTYVNGKCSNVSKIIPVKSELSFSSNNSNCAENRMMYFDAINLMHRSQNNMKLYSKIWMTPIFYLGRHDFSLVEIHYEGSSDHGLLWYRSTCPHEIYCMNIVPKYLRIYNVDEKAFYTFCPLKLSSGELDTDNCTGYKVIVNNDKHKSKLHIKWHIATGLICLFVGAVIIYLIIRTYPILLRGSKRVLFVKHKKLEALVLPPKVPLRTNALHALQSYASENNIFVLPTSNMLSPDFLRVGSMRSTRSGTPSYVSALQPTEDQLLEWRLRNHIDNYSTITSYSSSVSTTSLFCDEDSFLFSNYN